MPHNVSLISMIAVGFGMTLVGYLLARILFGPAMPHDTIEVRHIFDISDFPLAIREKMEIKAALERTPQ